jgi:hypothetical protein
MSTAVRALVTYLFTGLVVYVLWSFVTLDWDWVVHTTMEVRAGAAAAMLGVASVIVLLTVDLGDR